MVSLQQRYLQATEYIPSLTSHDSSWLSQEFCISAFISYVFLTTLLWKDLHSLIYFSCSCYILFFLLFICPFFVFQSIFYLVVFFLFFTDPVLFQSVLFFSHFLFLFHPSYFCFYPFSFLLCHFRFVFHRSSLRVSSQYPGGLYRKTVLARTCCHRWSWWRLSLLWSWLL